MKTIKFGDKEYQIQFGYIVTAKSGIIGKIANIEKMMNGEMTPEEIDKFLYQWMDRNQDDPIDIIDSMILQYSKKIRILKDG